MTRFRVVAHEDARVLEVKADESYGNLVHDVSGHNSNARMLSWRWRIEQDYRELKDELGLDHFEGRSWTGWHHHVTLVSMAYAFLVLERVRAKKNLAADVAPDPASAPAAASPTG